MQWPKLKRSNRHQGYFLFELMIVVALIALLMTFVLSYQGFMGRAAVRAELEQMRAACLYLQRRALQEGTQQELRIDQVRRTYTCDGAKHKFMGEVAFGAMPGVKGPPSAPRTEISRPITFQDERIIFHPNGTILPGTVYLTDRKKSCLYALSSGIGSAWDIHSYHYAGKWQVIG